MKILILARHLNRAGAERQIVTLANGLASIGENVTVAVFYKGGALDGELESSVTFIDFGKANRWDLANLAIRFGKLVNDGGYDVVYSFLVPPNILTLVALVLRFRNKQPKIVWGIRDSEVDYSEYGFIRRLLPLIQLFFLGVPNRVIVNSQAAFNELAHKNAKFIGKLKCVPNGIDTDFFVTNQKKGAKTRLKLGIKKNVKLITMLAREDPKKGHEYFLRAASEVCKVSNKYMFVCAGGQSPEFERYSKDLRDLTSKLGLDGRVKWVGEVSDVVGILNASDLVTVTSTMGEGFPNVIGEAMSCGKPVVVTDVGDSRIIVDDSEWVVSPKCPKSLAESWMSILVKSSSELEILGIRNRKNVITNYSVGKMVQDTLAILNNC